MYRQISLFSVWSCPQCHLHREQRSEVLSVLTRKLWCFGIGETKDRGGFSCNAPFVRAPRLWVLAASAQPQIVVYPSQLPPFI